MDVLDRFWTEFGADERLRDVLRFQSRRYPAIARFLAPWGTMSSKKILDIGGGFGSLSVLLHDRLGGVYEVADISPASPELRTAGAAFGIHDYHTIDLAKPDGLASLPGGYDLLLFVEVLEHLLVNPVILFRQMARLLSPSGRLLITTPNQARLRNRFRLLMGHSIRDHDGYPDLQGAPYGHVAEYTVQDLKGYLARAGFGMLSSDIVQNLGGKLNGPSHSLTVSAMNLGSARRLALGDDILTLFQLDSRSP